MRSKCVTKHKLENTSQLFTRSLLSILSNSQTSEPIEIDLYFRLDTKYKLSIAFNK